jgi:1,4-alpha-glucan branching enzyme
MPNVVPHNFLELTDGLRRIIEARHHDPFAELGYHQIGDHQVIRVFHPEAEALQLADQSQSFTRIEGTDIFVLTGTNATLPSSYRLRWTDRHGEQHIMEDPYRFGPQLGDTDLYLFNEGSHRNLYDLLGAHEVTVEGVAGTMFAVWAPGAARVSVVGDFNQWDGRVHPMRSRGQSGVWE